MDKIPHSNTSSSLQYGLSEGRTIVINPGETKMVDAPASKKMVEPQKGPPVAPVQTALEELLSKPVKEIAELLPAMTEPELEQVLAAERAAPTPRSTLIKEIEANILALKAEPQG